MAFPRVFVSSTCYDLAQIRDSLTEFIASYCYEPILSDRGYIFYHPDLHTHESCVNEIDNCQLFILIIGGRFGGNYISDKTKSIVNAEYEAARFRKIPVFTFIKREVFEDHRVYQKNKKDEELVKKIVFPSIENQTHSVNIFEFINQVRLAEVNNGFFSFEFAKDIKHYLGKQWAGMMFDFLNNKTKNESEKIVKNTLDNLTLLNKKTEELLEGIVRKINPESGNDEINNLDRIISASQFYKHILDMFRHENEDWLKTIGLVDPLEKEWYEYLAFDESFTIEDMDGIFEESPAGYKTLLSLNKGLTSWSVKTENNIYHKDVIKARKLFEEVKKLNFAEIQKAILFTKNPDDIQ